MAFRNHERNIRRYAIVSRDLENVLHQLRLRVQRLPGDGARLERIVFEGNEGQVAEASAGFQVGDESSHPGSAAPCIGPDVDVFVHTLKNRPAQFEPGIDFVNRRSPLQVECAVVFRHRMLAVGLFAQLDVADGVTALLDVCDLGRGVLGCSVEHGDGNHGRQIVRDAAGEKQVEAGVLVFAVVADIGGRVPRINRR